MAYSGKQLKINGVTYTAQSADPTGSSLTEGHVFYSDGTVRAEGLWVYKNSSWNPVGTGGGDVDTIHLVRASSIVIADVDLDGNNAAFDGGGVLVGTKTLSTTAADLLLLDANSVIKYDANGSDGSDDYIGFTKSIPLGSRGRYLGFQFDAKNDSTVVDNDFRFCVKQKDGTNAGDIQYFNMDAAYKADNAGTTMAFQAYLMTDCTEIEFGWQSQTTTTTAELIVDNILVSSKAFIDKQIQERTSEIKYMDSDNSPSDMDYDNLIIGERYKIVLNAYMLHSSSTTQSITITHDGNTLNTGIVDGARGKFSIVGEFIATATTLTFTDAGAGTVYGNGTTSETFAELIKIGFIDGVVHSNGTYINTVEKILSADVSSTGDISEWQFDNLIEGNWYDLSGQLFSNTGSYTVKFFSGAGGTGDQYGKLTEAGYTNISEPSFKFKATSSTMYVNTAAIGGLIYGNSTKDESFLQLKEVTDVNSVITPLTRTAYIKDVKASGVSGGTFTSGAWQTRTLNTLSGDTSFLTLSSNQFTLPAGKYKFKARPTAQSVDRHQARLVSDPSGTPVEEILGTTLNAANADSTGNASLIEGELTLTTSTTFEIQHRCLTTRATFGFGEGHSWGNNVYTQVKITKLI